MAFRRPAQQGLPAELLDLDGVLTCAIQKRLARPSEHSMKVLHIITCLDTGGAEASLHKLIKHSGDGALDHVVCSLNGKGSFGPRIEALGVPVFAFNGRPVGLTWAVPRLVSRIRPDIVQGWMYHGNLAATWPRSLRFTKAPVLWNIRQSLYDIRLEKRGTALVIRVEKSLSRVPCRIIYNSHISAEQHEAFGYSGTRKEIIPNGFDIELFRPDGIARHAIREEIGIGDDTPLVGLIARYHPMKDHTNFLNAARLIKAVRPQTMFVLVGRDTARALSGGHAGDIGESVRVLGERSDMPAISAALDVAVLSSSHGEAFPNVIGEAMACAVPCVATDVGDARRIIGDTGQVVPARDAQALASAVLSLLDRPDRRQVGERARQRIVSEFSVAATSAMYGNLYRQVLES